MKNIVVFNEWVVIYLVKLSQSVLGTCYIVMVYKCFSDREMIVVIKEIYLLSAPIFLHLFISHFVPTFTKFVQFLKLKA